MPKAPRMMPSYRMSPALTPHTDSNGHGEESPTARNATIWSAADDDVLMGARASGLNWQPIASKHFPSKTANACRKRHERLMNRRNHGDWNAEKLEKLAHEYVNCRRDMWSILAARFGERWPIVEAKCMEKGLKTIQSAARASTKRSAANGTVVVRDEEEHEGDSGLGLSDGEVETGRNNDGAAAPTVKMLQPLQTALEGQHMQRQAPPPLPLYQPPAAAFARAHADGRPASASSLRSGPRIGSFDGQDQGYRQRNGVSIQSILSPIEPSCF